jgi:phage portal protein BeeE
MTTPTQEMWHNPAMALFNRVTKAAVSPAPAQAKAAAAGGYSSSMSGVNMVGQYYTYYEGEARNRAMSVATISRARDLMASVIGSMPLKMYTEKWNEEERETEKVYIAPRSWLRQPDPTVTYNFLMAWTFDDLFFYGRAFWYITSRTQDGFPASFTRLPAGSVTTTDQAGPVWYAPSKEVYFLGNMIDPKDLVQFLSPIQGIVYMSEQTVATALKLEAARYRNAESSIPAGVLKQTGGEPLSAQELADLASAFNAARATNQTAALNEFLSYTETSATPDKMLLIDAANYQALECARLTNVPPYLVGVSTGAYSYQSSEQARADLYIFGVQAYASCIAATLSQNNVLPRGTYLEYDTEDFLVENELADKMDSPDMPEENTQEELAE